MKSKGFTLIELLVVIAIISLLSSVVLSGIKNGRQKAFETKTVQSIRQLQNALELYKSETGHYPQDIFYSYNYTSINGTPPESNAGTEFRSSTFKKVFDVEAAFPASQMPDSFMVYYEPSYMTTYGYTLLCDPNQNKPLSSIPNDSYTITVDYANSTGLLSKFPKTYYVEPTFNINAEGYYFNGKTACFGSN